MSKIFSRRDFLKLAGTGAAAATALTGCGPASRYVVRKPYPGMPEYNQTGVSTYYATTCRECPAGCGIIVRTMEGRAIKVEGNPNHPVSRGKVCSAGLTSVQGLYNPDRISGPMRLQRGGSGSSESMTWDAAVEVVRGALSSNPPESLGFLLGLTSDHLYDLVTELAAGLGAFPPARFGAMGMLDGRATLSAAAGEVLGTAGIPFFDLAQADLVLAFGDILNTWVSPVAYTRALSAMRQGRETRRGYLVAIEPSMSQTGATADEWIPAAPGTEGLVALAIGRLAGELRGADTGPSAGVDPAAISQQSGVPEETLRHLAQLFAESTHPLAIPGSGSLAHAGGLDIARAILNLGLMAGTTGQPGGMQVPGPGLLDTGQPDNPAVTPIRTDETNVSALIDRMNNGQVKVLFIHGVNPAFELPAGYRFAEALAKVPMVISFASFPDETSQLADYIFPDHTGLESWGYQSSLHGSDRTAISGMQPVVSPLHDTRSTADVLLAAQTVLPYQDEVAFLQQRLLPLVGQSGFFAASDVPNFWAQWLQSGGWWAAQPNLASPETAPVPATGGVPAAPAALGDGEYYLITQGTSMGDGSGANRPWLQETPHPLTTVMWNSWVQMNPETAAHLGVVDDDVVKITSPSGEVEASVYIYPAIRPDTVAVPFGQGHTALGQFAAGRGFNPAVLLGSDANAAAGEAYADVRVRITPTGKRRPLARLESRVGVYGGEFR